MLPFLIPAPDLEPETGVPRHRTPPLCHPPRACSGGPTSEASDLDGHVAWGFIGPGGGGFVLWGGDETGAAGWAIDEAESWSIGFSDDGSYGRENREFARLVFGEALEMDGRPAGQPASEAALAPAKEVRLDRNHDRDLDARREGRRATTPRCDSDATMRRTTARHSRCPGHLPPQSLQGDGLRVVVEVLPLHPLDVVGLRGGDVVQSTALVLALDEDHHAVLVLPEHPAHVQGRRVVARPVQTVHRPGQVLVAGDLGVEDRRRGQDVSRRPVSPFVLQTAVES